MSQHLREQMLENSKAAIKEYIKDMLGCSTDQFELINYKIEIHKEVVYIANEFKANEENLYAFNELTKLLAGIKEIKGMTPLVLISDKIFSLRDYISFLEDTKEN